MKPFLYLLLAGSLATNAWLLFAPRDARTAPPPPANISQLPIDDNRAPALPAGVLALVQSGDASSADRLRALGLPEHLVRAWIQAEVENRYREREKALYASDESRYWIHGYWPHLNTSTNPSALLDLNREKDAELKRLLGADWEDIRHEWVNKSNQFLPPEKRTQLRLIEEDYASMTSRSQRLSLIRLPEDQEKQAYLEKQKRADIEALLTPEELAQYDLRHSQTAQQLAWTLGNFETTEEEFKTLYALQKPFDEKFSSSRGFVNTPELQRERNEAQKTLDAAIEEALGEQRYAEYKRAQDRDYRLLRQLTPRLDVTAANVNEAYALKTSLEKRLREFKPVAGSDAKQQRADFQKTLAAEAETEFTRLLGEKGFSAVSDQLLRRIRPPTTPPAQR